ncbi:MAG: ADOP family duplicated permease [Candidatus Acidiferrales bacterium]|jgi:predicted permease|nr:ADOP family duplicated permease [Candidatus Acidoferrales bacterium]
MNKLMQDIRYGLRMLAKSPGFAAVAILTLALGIGANTAIFSLIDAVMLRSLPVDNPSQLMLLKWTAHKSPDIHSYMSSGDCQTDMQFGAANPSGCSFSEPMFREIAKTDTFAGVAAFANSGRLDLTGNGPAAVINGQLVSGDFFHTMGVKAAAGRVFEASDDSRSAASVAVLNYGYWQSAFGGSRNVIGRTIELNNVPFTIVGVAESRFTGVTPGSDYDVWLPLSDGERINPQAQIRDRLGMGKRQDDVASWWLTIIGRVKPNTPVAQAQAIVSGVFRNEMLHGAVPMFHGGGLAGGSGPRPGGAAGGGMVRQQIVMGGGPGPAPGGGNAPIGSAPPQMAPGKGPIEFHGAPPSGNVPFGAASPQMAQGKGPVEFRGPASGGQMPQSAGKKPLVMPGPQGAAPAGGMQGGESANGPKTLSTAADNPEITLVPAQSGLTGSRTRYSDPLYVLMLAVGIILLIACANVAGLMLARATARQKEVAVRLALGAGRARIVRQLLTESVMLSVLGGALGILFAYWGAHAIISFVSSNQTRPLGFATGIDMRVLGFTVAVSLVTGIIFGLAPAFRSARIDLTPILKDGEGSSASGGRAGKWFSVGNALVVTQVALAIVVLVGAGLLVRTLENLRSVDVGFDAHNIVVFAIDPTLAGYKGAQVDSFYRDLRGRLAETPGVKAVSYSQMPLLSGGLMITSFHWPGTPQDQESDADTLEVGPSFFETMHIPFLAGRNFNISDYELAASNHGPSPTAAPSPVIVNQTFVEKYLGKENPIGKQFGQSPADANGPANPGYQIVGVVRDTKYNSLRREIHAMMYGPQAGGGASFEVRTAADPQALLPAIRKVVAQVNANLPLFNVNTESEQIDRLLFQERLVARVSGFFGLLALVLACIGLYGLLSYEVARRTREIGIRMALGAQQRDVLRLVVGQGILLALVGAAVGIGAAMGVTRYMASMLYDVHANDPATIAGVAILLTLVALAACYIPARRATRVDPMVALRYE